MRLYSSCARAQWEHVCLFRIKLTSPHLKICKHLQRMFPQCCLSVEDWANRRLQGLNNMKTNILIWYIFVIRDWQLHKVTFCRYTFIAIKEFVHVNKEWSITLVCVHMQLYSVYSEDQWGYITSYVIWLTYLWNMSAIVIKSPNWCCLYVSAGAEAVYTFVLVHIHECETLLAQNDIGANRAGDLWEKYCLLVTLVQISIIKQHQCKNWHILGIISGQNFKGFQNLS